MTRPLVSVIIPVHQGEGTLLASLESLAAQTLQDFEVLVVDDASTDRSVDLARAWADGRARVLTMDQNGGPGLARNRGLREARGAFVAFLDADDRATPNRLARQVEALETHPDHGFVGSWFDIVDGTGRVLQTRRPTQSPTLLAWTATLHGPIQNSTLMVRRSAAPGDGNLFAACGQGEGDHAYRLLLGRRPGHLVREVLCHYLSAGPSAATRRQVLHGGATDTTLTAAYLTTLLRVPISEPMAERIRAILLAFPDQSTAENREAVSLFLMTFLAFRRTAPSWCDQDELDALEESYRVLAAPFL
ncbi:MAG: glycosyltransferase [Rhodospirillum sp.]|nr:glycosyltransferase [Rhodospirillum sp.]MCF8487659.1 glycosyltransferase [Rhodospirillum sp.]MCF8500404.1 glycosyltransferase [Rhodospirillum sp.]